MIDRSTRQLKAREAALLAELRSRRSNDEKQAALIAGDDLELNEDVSEASSDSLSTSERQAAMAIARTTDYSGTNSERQARAALGVDPGVETDLERKRRRIREAFNRSSD
ncbi:hypothetical protein [Microbacterium sp. BH-3-3-3]|uniref:hypothetical protein n=1 Tax=Microbacterium sp. BH-3-3-3 TaxID=1906742 RepID=UPI0011A80454|nr:hypothetical protein [Microbacterium sp. BH-3-3-3]